MTQSLNDEFDIPRTSATRKTGRRNSSTANNDGGRTNNADDTHSTDDKPSVDTSRTDKKASSEQRQPRRHRHVQEQTKRHRGLLGFLFDRRLHLFVGVACVLVGGVMAIMLFSHIRNGGIDQSKAANLPMGQMAEGTQPIENVTGSFGAKISHILFTDSLGMGSLAIAAFLIILGFRILRRRPLCFWSLTFKTLLLTVSLSIVSGLIGYWLGTEINWGGTHGYFINHKLMTLGGPIIAGTVSIILIVAIICLYINDITRLYNKWHSLRPQSATPASGQKTHQVTYDNINDEPIIEPLAHESGNDSDLNENISQSEDFEDGSFTIDENPEQPATDADNFVVEAPNADIIDDGEIVADNKPYDHRASLSRYRFPSLDLLDDVPQRATVDMEEQEQNKERIIKALEIHKVTISSIKATVGPTVTLFEVVPTDGTRIAQIKRLEDDIAMTLKARGIRIIAPMPGKGTVGIEVPNNDPQNVPMRQVLSSKKFRESTKQLPVALGATVSNDIFVADLASMPHVLVAGATGQGKSVGLNVIITSLLYKKHPTELKFVLIDPKEVEFSLYSKLCNHYLAAIPGVDEDTGIITSNENVKLALGSLCALMDKRYSLLRQAGVRNIVEYNKKFTERRLNPEKGHEFMPYIVVIIDEFADLIMTAGKEIEMPVTRITQKARAVGIHMIIATQRPSTNVLTGLIKANCPTRIAFRVMQMVDSRTILDRPGANQLIGKGDMLYSSGGEIERMQCAWISTEEVSSLCDFVGNQIGFEKPYMLPEPINTEAMVSGTSHATAPGMDRDPLFDEAARFVITQSSASVSSLQRRYQIGYNRAGKIMDQMEAAGIVGPGSGSKPRNILVDGITLELILENKPQ